MLGMERDGDGTRVPAREQRGHEVVPGRAHDRDAIVVAVVASSVGDDHRRQRRRGPVDRRVGPRAAGIDDCQPVAVLSDALRHGLAVHGPNGKRR
jgi:hypothetical protein